MTITIPPALCNKLAAYGMQTAEGKNLLDGFVAAHPELEGKEVKVSIVSQGILETADEPKAPKGKAPKAPAE